MVALNSQLHPQAQQQAGGQFGFDNTHTDILRSEAVAAHIMTAMAKVKNPFPPSHLRLLQQGGFDLPSGETYPPVTRHAIRYYGKFLMALTTGRLAPIHPEEKRFVAVVNGKKAPKDDAEKAWLLFVSEHPELQ